MHPVELIIKKRNGLELSNEELHDLIQGYTQGTVPDYQMSAFLMAGFLNGFTPKETTALTQCMAASGDQLDLSSIPGIKVDKHSTGGVGDKTTLIVGPIAAACGIPVVKMSGRGLGHTGGTVDKLMSIPGYQINLDENQMMQQVREIGIALVGQTGNLTPADKKLYALRDVTGTVESIPLIASSIMSKKLAAGADAVLLDVKVGSGAFMKTPQDAHRLGMQMLEIGKHAGRKTAFFLTDMSVPLGRAVGNRLEIWEAVLTLLGNGPEDLTNLCIELAAGMLTLANQGDFDHCKEMAWKALRNGDAFQKFRQLIQCQGGDLDWIDHPEQLLRAPFHLDWKAPSDGWITQIDSYCCGLACCRLGAGREKLDDIIDYDAGVLLHKTYGEQVKKGDVVATLFCSQKERLQEAVEWMNQAISIENCPPQARTLIYERTGLEQE